MSSVWKNIACRSFASNGFATVKLKVGVYDDVRGDVRRVVEPRARAELADLLPALEHLEARHSRLALAESLLLSFAGGVAGLTIAWWGVDAAAALAPDQLTRMSASEIGIDGRVFAFAIASAVIAGR